MSVRNVRCQMFRRVSVQLSSEALVASSLSTVLPPGGGRFHRHLSYSGLIHVSFLRLPVFRCFITGRPARVVFWFRHVIISHGRSPVSVETRGTILGQSALARDPVPGYCLADVHTAAAAPIFESHAAGR